MATIVPRRRRARPADGACVKHRMLSQKARPDEPRSTVGSQRHDRDSAPRWSRGDERGTTSAYTRRRRPQRGEVPGERRWRPSRRQKGTPSSSRTRRRQAARAAIRLCMRGAADCPDRPRPGSAVSRELSPRARSFRTLTSRSRTPAPRGAISPAGRASRRCPPSRPRPAGRAYRPRATRPTARRLARPTRGGDRSGSPGATPFGSRNVSSAPSRRRAIGW